MHRLNELAEKLTPAQVKEVEDFAEFLITRAGQTASRPNSNRVRFDGWAGCMAGVEPEKSDKQLIREAWDEVIDRMDRQG